VTVERYENAAASLVQYTGLPLRTLSHPQLDATLAEYMEHLYLEGETAAVARYTLYGVSFVLDLVTRDHQVFPLSKKMLKGFMRKAPEPSRDPPPYQLAWLAADFFVRSYRGRLGALAAAATLIAADGYLRPSEALGLRKEDFFCSGRGAQQEWSVVVAPLTRAVPAKNKQFDDGYIAGGHDRTYVKSLLKLLVPSAPLGEKIFAPLSLPHWEKMYREFSKEEGVRMTPHGLRHTGPSHDFHAHNVPLHSLQMRGRWLCIESCRRYAKPARLLRGVAALSRGQLLRAAKCEEELIKTLHVLLGRTIDKVGVTECGTKPLKRPLMCTKSCAPDPRQLRRQRRPAK
jgi:integrase